MVRRPSPRRARWRRRGAALVEAAITIPFFTTIFVALLFVGRLYTTKMRTLSLARQQTWVYAMRNCEGDMPEVKGTSDGALPQQDGMDFGETQQFESAPGGDTASKGSRTATSTVKGKASSIVDPNSSTENKLGPLSAEIKLQTTAWVTCNEKPQPGDLHGVLSTAWGLFTQW